MTRLEWGVAGERFYESGVDRGVLFRNNAAGVSWAGLTSVKEDPSGGDPRPYYLDGIKYLNLASSEEYVATIEAFSAPAQFAACEGLGVIAKGFVAAQQRRETFGFSYRTRVGNDLKGTDFGYKLHLVYNALAQPASTSRDTISGDVTPLKKSWGITTTPVRYRGLRPTAHFVIDTRYFPPAALALVEDALYGTDNTNAYLPTVAEIIEFMQTTAPLVNTNYATDPYVKNASMWSHDSPMARTKLPSLPESIDIYALSDVMETKRWLMPSSSSLFTGFVANDILTVSCRIQNVGESLMSVGMSIYRGSDIIPGTFVSLPTEEFTYASCSYVIPEGADLTLIRPAVVATGPQNAKMRVSEIMFEKGPVRTSFFTGDTLNTPTDFYLWLGEVNASRSVHKQLT